MLKFYFHPTPNPMKVALFLAEAALEHQLIPIDTLKGEQHQLSFRQVNPNGKLPVIDDDGTVVFDSNAILLYLADKTGQFNGTSHNRGELLSWLMFIASGLGPFSGQSVHFQRMAPETVPYAINRYRREAARHYEVLNERLRERDFIVGDNYTIVDMAAWGWIDRASLVLDDGELDNYPELVRWFNGINARPAVKIARQTGKEVAFKSERDELAQRALFPQNYPEPIATHTQ